MRHKRSTPEHREFETHYFYDARMTIPAPPQNRGYAKTEEGARRACVMRVDQEQFNKAVIVQRDTNVVLHVYRRDPKTGNIERQDHRYRALLGQGRLWGPLA